MEQLLKTFFKVTHEGISISSADYLILLEQTVLVIMHELQISVCLKQWDCVLYLFYNEFYHSLVNQAKLSILTILTPLYSSIFKVDITSDDII